MLCPTSCTCRFADLHLHMYTYDYVSFPIKLLFERNIKNWPFWESFSCIVTAFGSMLQDHLATIQWIYNFRKIHFENITPATAIILSFLGKLLMFDVSFYSLNLKCKTVQNWNLIPWPMGKWKNWKYIDNK